MKLGQTPYPPVPNVRTERAGCLARLVRKHET